MVKCILCDREAVFDSFRLILLKEGNPNFAIDLDMHLSNVLCEEHSKRATLNGYENLTRDQNETVRKAMKQCGKRKVTSSKKPVILMLKRE